MDESELVSLAGKVPCGNTFSPAKRPKGLAGVGLGRYPSRFLAQVQFSRSFGQIGDGMTFLLRSLAMIVAWESVGQVAGNAVEATKTLDFWLSSLRSMTLIPSVS